MPVRVDNEIYFSAAEVAQVCGVSRQTVWRWRQAKLIPTGRTSHRRTVVFSDTEVELIRSRASRLADRRSPVSTEIYLDNAASTRPLGIVVDAMARAMAADFGNPSSAHGAGRRARQAVEDAREQVAGLVGGDRTHVTFTSGGTEANYTIVRAALARGMRRLVTSAVEHSSVFGAAELFVAAGGTVTVIPVTAEGLVHPAALLEARPGPDTLVSIQWANNETGVIQPVSELAAIAKGSGALVHCDAAQAVGKLELDFMASAVDAITISAHKIHGPQGVGALLAKRTLTLASFSTGGSQEGGRRVGTENYPGIVGMGVAAEHRTGSMRVFLRNARGLRDHLEQRLLSAFTGTVVHGASAPRVCCLGNLRIDSVDGQALIAQLDAASVRLSQTSACTNMQPEPSHVLRAMGLSDSQAYASFRYAVSEDSTFEEVDAATDLIVAAATRLGAEPRVHRTRSSDKEAA